MVYHGIWSYASLLEYTIRRARRMGAEIEAALRSEASAKEESERWKNGARGDVFARAAGGETKGRVQYTGADITAFICYVDTGTE